MRMLLAAATLAALAPAAGAEDWIAVCYGRDAQYTQTIGGEGYFHVGNGDRTYDTQKLLQSFHDGNRVCGTADTRAPRASSGISEVCADKANKTVSVMFLSETGKRITPENATLYCQARISVL